VCFVVVFFLQKTQKHPCALASVQIVVYVYVSRVWVVRWALCTQWEMGHSSNGCSNLHLSRNVQLDYLYTFINAHIHAHIHRHAWAHTHIHTYIHTGTDTQSYVDTDSHTYTHTVIRTHTQSYVHTHARHTHVHGHTHRDTRTQYIQCSWCC